MLVAIIMKFFLHGKLHGPETLSYTETIFNEGQSGKDQYDRDSMTAKRQMQYYIERGNNIETPDQMYDAMCKATALSGFTANVLDITEKKSYPKTKSKTYQEYTM